jgi:hypothetical protein
VLNDMMKEVVKRLRSGTIKQTTGVLGRTDGSRCCLGVMCDVAVDLGVIPAPEPIANCKGDILIYGHYTTSLPQQVLDLTGLCTPDGSLGEGKGSLAENNDSGATFSEIADIIESEPEGLFVNNREQVAA